MLAAMTANSIAFQNELRDGIAGLVVMLKDSESIPVSSGLQYAAKADRVGETLEEGREVDASRGEFAVTREPCVERQGRQAVPPLLTQRHSPDEQRKDALAGSGLCGAVQRLRGQRQRAIGVVRAPPLAGRGDQAGGILRGRRGGGRGPAALVPARQPPSAS